MREFSMIVYGATGSRRADGTCAVSARSAAMTIQGKPVAIVTGGESGIGKACALSLTVTQGA